MPPRTKKTVPAARPAKATGERLVDGKRVVKVERENSPMVTKAGTPAPFKDREILHLDDGSHVFGCPECFVTNPERAPVMRHYRDVHVATRTATAKATPRAQGALGDIALMTIGELVHLAGAIRGHEDVVTRLTDERDAAKSELAELKKRHAALLKTLSKAGFVPKLEDQ